MNETDNENYTYVQKRRMNVFLCSFYNVKYNSLIMTIALWFNFLSVQSRNSLNLLMRAKLRFDYLWHVESDFTKKQLTRTIDEFLNDDIKWCLFARCEMMRLKTNNKKQSQHSRWQIRIKFATDESSSTSSINDKIKSRLNSQEWQTLISLENQVKLFCHHIAYAFSAIIIVASLSLNNDANEFISHHCDQIGCICLDHIFVVISHFSNLDRQRCLKIILIVFNNHILLKRLCEHDVKLISVEKLLTSCRKIYIICMSNDVATWMHRLFEKFINSVDFFLNAFFVNWDNLKILTCLIYICCFSKFEIVNFNNLDRFRISIDFVVLARFRLKKLFFERTYSFVDFALFDFFFCYLDD